MKNKDNLVDQCCKYFGLSLPKFAEKYDMPESTLKQWRTKLPWYGKMLMEEMIKNHKLEEELEKKESVLGQLQTTFNELSQTSNEDDD